MIRITLALIGFISLAACSGTPDDSDDSPTSTTTPNLASPSSPPETVSEPSPIPTDVPTSSNVTQTPAPDVPSNPPVTFPPEPTVPPGSEPTLPPGVTRLFYFPQIEGADFVQFYAGELHTADMNGDNDLDVVLSSASVDQGDKAGVGCVYLLLTSIAPIVAVNLDYTLKICGDSSGRYLGEVSSIVASAYDDIAPTIAVTVRAHEGDCAILKLFKSQLRGSYTDESALFSVSDNVTCQSPYATEMEAFSNSELGNASDIAFTYRMSDGDSAISMLSGSDMSKSLTTSQLSTSITAVNSNYAFGGTVVASVDVDEDGYQDLFISDPIGDTAERGLIYLFNGPIADKEMTSEDANVTFVGEESYIQCYGVPLPNCEPIGNEIGRYFAADGDFNGDGRTDLAVLAIQPDPGKIWIVYQPYASREELRYADAQLIPNEVSSMGGIRPLVVGDTNEDGRDELLFQVAIQGQGTALKLWRTPFTSPPSWSDLCTVRQFQGDTGWGGALWKGENDHYFIYARRDAVARIYEFTHEQLKARIECPSDPVDVKASP